MSVAPEDAALRRHQLRPLYAAGFVTAFGAHAVAANLGRYASGHHTSLVELGVLLALYDGAEVILKPVFGALSDRIGPRPVLLGGLVGFALASAAFALAGEPDMLGLARFAQGASAAAFSPAAGAMVAALGAGGSRGRAFGGYGAAKGLGYLLGPVAGGLVVAARGYGVLFALLGALALAVAIAVVVTVAPVPATPRAARGDRWAPPPLGATQLRRPRGRVGSGDRRLQRRGGVLPRGRRPRPPGPGGHGPVGLGPRRHRCRGATPGGQGEDAGRLPGSAAGAALGAAALGMAIAATLSGPAALAAASVLVGLGVGLATPLGFAAAADAAPEGRMGQTMGAAEVGREVGDAGGPLVVGALASVSLGTGLGGLALLVAATGVLARRTRHAAGDADRDRP